MTNSNSLGALPLLSAISPACWGLSFKAHIYSSWGRGCDLLQLFPFSHEKTRPKRLNYLPESCSPLAAESGFEPNSKTVISVPVS